MQASGCEFDPHMCPPNNLLNQEIMNIDKANTLKYNCVYCNASITSGNIRRHEKSCRINPLNQKNCPVCNNLFSGKNTTCSHSCSNTYFRSKEKHPNWKEDSYRTTCFVHHDKKCIVCGEDKIVEVHHLDENKLNNDPSNLIPLCPTHHQYWHSRYKYLIESVVYKYVEDWKKIR